METLKTLKYDVFLNGKYVGTEDFEFDLKETVYNWTDNEIIDCIKCEELLEPSDEVIIKWLEPEERQKIALLTEEAQNLQSKGN